MQLQAMERIHAITAEGEVLRDIAVFRRLYQAVGLGWVSADVSLSLLGSLMRTYLSARTVLARAKPCTNR